MITDVPGVEVGHVTLVQGDAVRTGVTAVLPRGRGDDGCARLCRLLLAEREREMTGIAWLEEAGVLDGPVLITNTNAVGVIRDAVIQYARRAGALDRDGPTRSGRCRWWRRRGTAPSTTSTAGT